MQDLNNKINNGGATADGVLPAEQWNEVSTELQNAIVSTGVSLSGGDLQQVAKAITHYTHNGNNYTVGGTANAITLTPVGSMLAPTAYSDGMEVRFEAASTNTGSVTINVNGIGVVSLLTYENNAAPSNTLCASRRYSATYRASSAAFVLAAPAAYPQLLASGDLTGLTSVEFILSALDPTQSSANEYQFIIEYRPTADSAQPRYTISSDGGVSYQAAGYNTACYGNDTTGASDTVAFVGGYWYFHGAGPNNAVGDLARQELRFLSMNTGASKRPYCMVDRSVHWNYTATAFEQNDGASTNTNAADYDAIKLTMSSSTFAEGSYKLYKIA